MYGERNLSDLYAKGETGSNIKISYNTFNQEIEFYSSANANKALVKETGMVDSFEIKANMDLNIGDLKFVYAPLIGLDEKISSDCLQEA